MTSPRHGVRNYTVRMKRDMDLIRQLLLAIEETKTWDRPFELHVDEHDRYDVTYHLRLLESKGLIEGIDVSTHDGPKFWPRCLTWEGHEFLENAKNETVWQQTKKRLAEAGGSASFEVIKALLTQVAFKVVLGTK